MGNEFFEKLVNNKLVDHLKKFGFFLISSLTSGLLIQPQFWQKFWQVFAYWHSSKYDQVSDLGQQLGAWSGLLISLLEKFNLFHLTSQMKQDVIDVKMNKSNFDEKSSYDVRVAFLL